MPSSIVLLQGLRPLHAQLDRRIVTAAQVSRAAMWHAGPADIQRAGLRLSELIWKSPR